MTDKKELEDLYLKAKAEYYKGTPIMSDLEFDDLENKLKNEKSDVIYTVGFQDNDPLTKFKHPSPMLSMSKYQADGYNSHDEFLNLVNKWMKKFGDIWYEASPKFDGNAVNLIYKDGNLVAGLTRSTGTHGRDISSKCIGNPTIPQKINQFTRIVEIRCEIVYPIDKFKALNSKRAKKGLELFSNERNFVAGVLRDEKASKTEVSDLVFFAIGGFQYALGKRRYLSFSTLFDLGFNTSNQIYTIDFKSKDFEKIYTDMENYRKNSNFRLDGFVISTKSNEVKNTFGENKHDPNWAKAIKFPAAVAQPIILGIEQNVSKSGEIIPVALLEPTLLDGSIVSRASLSNFGLVMDNKYFPGAKVSLRKAGDIIPQVTNVVENAKETYTLPTNCPACESKLTFDGIHLMCNNQNCNASLLKEFIHSVKILDVFGLGDKVLENIFDAGITNVFDMFNPNIFNKENLIASNKFKPGRALDKIFIEFEKIKKISLVDIFRMLEIRNLGRSISKQLANEYCMLDTDYTGLDRTVVEEGRKAFSDVHAKVNLLMHRIKVIYPIKEKKKMNTIKVEFTGSSKSFGYTTKDAFLQEVNKITNVEHTKLTSADYLIADNIEGISSKIKNAHKKGIPIISYSDFINHIRN